MLAFADFHNPVMHYRSWNQPQPIYLHWKIYCCIFSSTWPHENNTCFNNGILFLWEGRSQSSCSCRDDNSCGWNDVVWQCLIKAWWKGTLESLSPDEQNRKPMIVLLQFTHYDGFLFAKVEHKIVDSRKEFNYF